VTRSAKLPSAIRSLVHRASQTSARRALKRGEILQTLTTLPLSSRETMLVAPAKMSMSGSSRSLRLVP
jgi:hypothetical protein